MTRLGQLGRKPESGGFHTMTKLRRRPRSVHKLTAGILLALAGIVVVATLLGLTWNGIPTHKPVTKVSSV
jgi:hypothetical protein